MASLKLFLLLLNCMFYIYFSDAVHGYHSKKGVSIKAKALSSASNHFGFNLLQKIAEKNDVKTPRENIFFSPYSIAVILSMVHQGAGGNTADQLKQALGYQYSRLQNRQAVATAVKNVNEHLKKVNSAIQFDTSNFMIFDKQLKIKDNYSKNVQQNFDCKIKPVDFKGNQNVMNIINQYVSEKTHGMIDRILDKPPSPDTQLALVNAVYFKGQWVKKFDIKKTETGVFYGENGQQYPNVQYMKHEGLYPHIELPELNADMIMMWYKGQDIALIGILPQDRDADLKEIRESLNATYIDQMVGKMILNEQLSIIFPRMEVSVTVNLPEPLTSLGIQDMFNTNANLSGITEQQLKISQAIHKAKLVINEEGTEAGAGSYIGIVALSLPIDPPTFRFDHPFLYFIRHYDTGQILFLGEVHQF